MSLPISALYRYWMFALIVGSWPSAAGAPPKSLVEEHPAIVTSSSGVTLSLAGIPDPATPVQCFVNGLRLIQMKDFQLTGQVITFMKVLPRTGDTVSIFYRPSSERSGSAALATTRALVQTDITAKQIHDSIAQFLLQTANVTPTTPTANVRSMVSKTSVLPPELKTRSRQAGNGKPRSQPDTSTKEGLGSISKLRALIARQNASTSAGSNPNRQLAQDIGSASDKQQSEPPSVLRLRALMNTQSAASTDNTPQR